MAVNAHVISSKLNIYYKSSIAPPLLLDDDMYLHDEVKLFAADGNEAELSGKLLGVVRELGQSVAPHRGPYLEVDAQLWQHRVALDRKAHARQVPDGDVDVVHNLIVKVVLQWPAAAPSAHQLLQQRLDGLGVRGFKCRFREIFAGS